MTGGLAQHLGTMLISLYDLFVMLPLGIERLVRRQRAGDGEARDEAGGEGAADDKPARSIRRRKAAKAADDSTLTTREV